MPQKNNENGCKITEIRIRCGYSIGDMALILGIGKSTLQCYENGSRTAPPSLINSMLNIERNDKEFMRRYVPGGAYDQVLARAYPHGIISAPVEE